MKPLFLLTLFLICAGEISAQDRSLAQDSIYYNYLWKETTADSASYYRVKVKSTAGWQVTDHFMNGKPQMTGGYADDSNHVKEGEFAWYDSSGIVSHRCIYKNGKLNGPETYYYSDGRLNISGENKDDEYNGEWTGYYPSGIMSGKAKFKKGKQVSGTFFHEDGSRDKTITEFRKDSEFPGGMAYWLRFLNKTLQYPDSAVNREIQGTVIVDFVVSKEGKPFNFHVSQPVDPSLDEEALRVLRLMPDWTPAISGGRVSESYKRQPIIFKLESQ
jgi:TonB family protein